MLERMVLMFFSKKEVLDIEKYKKIYEKYYEKLLNKLDDPVYFQNIEFELLPPLFFIFKSTLQLAVKNKKIKDKDREKIIYSISHLIITKYLSNKKELDLFLQRVDLYVEVISGLPLRNESAFSKPVPKEDRNLQVDTWTILSDILINPKCADDYVNAEKALVGSTETVRYLKARLSVLGDFFDLVEEIYNA